MTTHSNASRPATRTIAPSLEPAAALARAPLRVSVIAVKRSIMRLRNLAKLAGVERLQS